MRQFAFTNALPHLLPFIREAVERNVNFLAPSSHVVESTCTNVYTEVLRVQKQTTGNIHICLEMANIKQTILFNKIKINRLIYQIIL